MSRRSAVPVCGAVLVWLACGGGGEAEVTGPAFPAAVQAVHVGEIMPEVQARTVDGTTIDSGRWRGRVHILFFWALYCKTCLGGDLPDLQSMQDSFGPDRLNIVTVNPVDDRGELLEVKNQYRYTYDFVEDPDRSLWRRFGRMELPSVYVIDRTGVVRYRREGFDSFAVADLVRALQP